MAPEQRQERLSNASKGLEMIMNDNWTGAESVFHNFDDAFQDTGIAVKFTIKALLGFEKEEIKAAAVHLEKALSRCEAEHAKAKALPGSLFPDGAEFNVLIALILLQLAVTGFLSESIPEAMKAVWKLKRCYNIFYSLNKHMLTHSITINNVTSPHSRQNPDKTLHDQVATDPPSLERLSTHQLKVATGLGSSMSATDYLIACSTIAGHSLLSLIISIMPPTVSRILAVVGFRGNKQEALKDLWIAAEAPNILGGIGLLGLLLYFGDVLGQCDIVENEEIHMNRISVLMHRTVERYPNSAIWRLESARILQQTGDQFAGLNLLESISDDKSMKQVMVLKVYAMGFAYLTTLQWRKAADQFILVENSNDWSRSFYHYIIGSCYTELHRETGSEEDAKKAQEHFEKAPLEAGQKKIMGKEIPLETFLKRKISRWRARSTTKRILDGITVSPVLELCHLFNLWKKMNAEHRLKCLTLLNKHGKCPETEDDVLTRQMMEAALKRNMHDWSAFVPIAAAAKVHRNELKSIPFAETWALPFVYYEYAACLWFRDGRKGTKEIRVWLEKAKAFGHSELEDRLSIRIVNAFETLER